MPTSMALTTPEQFRAIGDGTRMRILGRLAQSPATILELAEGLGMPKGTVGHHVGVLVDAGLVHVVEERRVRAVIERTYARVAPYFRIGDDAGVAPTGAGPLRMIPLRHALEEATEPSSPDDPFASVLVRAAMSPERAQRFAELVERLADEFVDGAGGTGETFGFAAAIYRPDWGRRPRTGRSRRQGEEEGGG